LREKRHMRGRWWGEFAQIARIEFVPTMTGIVKIFDGRWV